MRGTLVFLGSKEWSDIEAEKGLTYNWDIGSTYIRYPPYFNDMSLDIEPLKDIVNAQQDLWFVVPLFCLLILILSNR